MNEPGATNNGTDFAAVFATSPAMREPRAELRQAAAGLHEMFVAMVTEGFTEQQALALISEMLPKSTQP